MAPKILITFAVVAGAAVAFGVLYRFLPLPAVVLTGAVLVLFVIARLYDHSNGGNSARPSNDSGRSVTDAVSDAADTVTGGGTDDSASSTGGTTSTTTPGNVPEPDTTPTDINDGSQTSDTMALGGLLSGSEEAAEEETREIHEMVKRIEEQEGITSEKMQIDEQLKGDLSEILHDLDDFMQHEQRLKNIVGNEDITLGEVLEHQDEIGQDLRAMRSDLAEINTDFREAKELINRKHQDVEKDEQNETAQEELFDHMLEQEKKMEKMEENLDKIITSKLDMS